MIEITVEKAVVADGKIWLYNGEQEVTLIKPAFLSVSETSFKGPEGDKPDDNDNK